MLDSKGNWILMDRIDTVNRKTRIFIRRLLEHFAITEIKSRPLLECIKIFRNSFGKLISYKTRSFQKIRIMVDTSIYLYSKEKFPSGKFIPFTCPIKTTFINVEREIIVDKEKEEAMTFFGFSSIVKN